MNQPRSYLTFKFSPDPVSKDNDVFSASVNMCGVVPLCILSVEEE